MINISQVVRENEPLFSKIRFQVLTLPEVYLASSASDVRRDLEEGNVKFTKGFSNLIELFHKGAIIMVNKGYYEKHNDKMGFLRDYKNSLSYLLVYTDFLDEEEKERLEFNPEIYEVVLRYIPPKGKRIRGTALDAAALVAFNPYGTEEYEQDTEPERILRKLVPSFKF